jgi:hypothetical protein
MSITKVTDAGLDRNRIVTPLIINGDMSVAQRGTDINDVAHQAYSVDRYRFHKVNTGELVMNIDQVTDVPTGQGFSNSLKLSVGTAESATASNELVSIGQRIEAQNLQNLRFGTSSAETLTLCFWVKSSVTGTYSVLMFQQDASSSPDRRYYSQPFTINAADTWEKKIINISGNQDDTISNDNGIGLDFRINLSAGSDLTSGSSNTWGSSTNTAVGQTANFSGTASATFFFTGVQMELGEFDTNTIPDFPFESRANNLQRCQRYFTVINNNGRNGDAFFCGFTASSTAISGVGYSLATPLRIGNPTITKNSSVPMQRCTVDGFQTLTAGAGTIGLTAEAEDSYILCINLGGYSGMTSSRPAVVSFPAATNAVTIDAEL